MGICIVPELLHFFNGSRNPFNWGGARQMETTDHRMHLIDSGDFLRVFDGVDERDVDAAADVQ